MKTLSKAVAIASLLSAGVMSANVANAEVEASASIASSFLWHGQNLSGGEGVVAGSLDWYNDAGVYAGIWSGSGDTKADGYGGSETDLYVGFAGEAGDLSYDIMYATYLYNQEDTDGVVNNDIDDIAEVVLSVGYDAFSMSVTKNTDTTKNGDYLFTTLGMETGDFAFTLGNISGSEEIYYATDYSYIDAAYAYNDAITFTFSQIVNQDVDDTYADDAQFVVSYSLPIE